MDKKKINTVVNLLTREYPHAKVALHYSNAWEMLVATILSAQCTDARVNMVTAFLFKKYKRIEEYASANLRTFEQDIRSTGFYRNKAKNIIGAAQIIVKKFAGKVPDSMQELIKLPGVARKTANVVLYNAFSKSEGIAVDTHVRRISQRLGLTKRQDPDKIEQDLMALLSVKEWGRFSYLLIEHGRTVCLAQKPKCLVCVLQDICPAKNNFFPNSKT